MLETLHIRNLATVSVLDIELASGLNVLTGETGAGKSIILGAVQVLLGERAEKTIIRKGESACEITASLYLGEAPEPLVRQVADTLENSGLPACEEDQLLLRRVVTRNGSRAYVNATPVTLDIMRQLGNLLVDIHGPNDHQSLLHPRCQRDLLDAFGSLAEARHACSACYEELTGTRESLDNLRNEHLSPAECEMLRYQLNEIESADLRPDEEEALNERHRTASHARSLLEIAGRCREGLSEGEGSICDQLSDYVRMMQEVEQMAPAPGRSFVQQTESVVETLQELSNDLTDLAESLELDQEELTRLEDRIETIHKLKRKYARSIDDILSEADRIRDRLTTLDSREQRIAELETQQRQAETNLYEHCSTLTASRREAAGRLGRAIAGKLKHLGFEQGAFDISVTEAAPGPAGADSIEFSFAPNPGEDMLPLRKIASSGEIARVMLAVKTVLTSADQVPVLIFDEVDANIGGRVATAVARELASVSTRHQVLCITHLPQIAAAANVHFSVGKHMERQRTVTSIERLDADTRIHELTRMMGAEESSAAARKHAEELLHNAVD